MVQTLKAFLRGPVGALGAAVSGLLTLIAVARFVDESKSGWMWLFLGALALVLLSFWRFHEMRQERDEAQEAPGSRLIHIASGSNPNITMKDTVVGGAPPGLALGGTRTGVAFVVGVGRDLLEDWEAVTDRESVVAQWTARADGRVLVALTAAEAAPWIRANALTEQSDPFDQLKVRVATLEQMLAEAER